MNDMKNLLKVILMFFLLPQLAIAQKIDGAQLLEDLKYLSSEALEGRKPLTEGSMKARELVKNRFLDLGLKSQYEDYTQYFDFTNRRDGKVYENAANIVGFIPGSESEKLIVVMAHYDHLGRQGDKIFYGADDNASGTAAVLAYASYFSENQPRHSMLFVALDAEEMGHQGAKALVADFPFPLAQVAVVINMDMISRNDKQELYAAGTYHYPQLKPALEKAAKGKDPKLLFGHDSPDLGRDDWTLASDHAQFHLKDVPFIYFGVEDHDAYHTPNDTFENIDQEFYVKAANLILESIIELDKDLLKR